MTMCLGARTRAEGPADGGGTKRWVLPWDLDDWHDAMQGPGTLDTLASKLRASVGSVPRVSMYHDALDQVGCPHFMNLSVHVSTHASTLQLQQKRELPATSLRTCLFLIFHENLIGKNLRTGRILER